MTEQKKKERQNTKEKKDIVQIARKGTTRVA